MGYTGLGSVYESDAYTSAITTDSTLTSGDSGIVLLCQADGITVTLPATDVGITYTIVNDQTEDGAQAVSVSPNASDRLMGVGISTNADDKDLTNTKATSKVRDSVTVFADGVDGWFVQRCVGTWARET